MPADTFSSWNPETDPVIELRHAHVIHRSRTGKTSGAGVEAHGSSEIGLRWRYYRIFDDAGLRIFAQRGRLKNGVSSFSDDLLYSVLPVRAFIQS